MYLDPIHSLSLCICPPPLQASPKIKQNSREKMKKIKWEKHKKEGIKNLIMEAAVWSNKSWHISLCPYISTCKYLLQRVIGWVVCPWYPLHVQWWTSTRILPGHPAVILCCGLFWGLWIRSLHMLQQIIDGMDVEAGQVITLGWGLSSYRVGLPDGKWGQFSHGHLHLR